METPLHVPVTRRTVLAGATATLTVALAAPVRVTAQAPPAPPLGMQESVQDGLKRVFGGRPIKDGAGTVKLEIPLIAENGAVVPITVDVASPMTPSNHVKHVYVVADKNRIPIIIPCHRVIQKNGQLRGYGGGLWRKQFLLDLETKGLESRA